MRRLSGITGLGYLQFPLRKGGVRGLFSPPLFSLRIRRGGKERADSRPDGAGGWVGLCFAIALLLCCSVALSEAFKLPATGQTTCYQSVSPYAEIACAGTGQDGAYNINPMTYTDNGNGTVTDNNTGLMWQQGENPSTYNWYQATGTYDSNYNPSSQNVCGSLNLGGYSDWRLPSKKELITIVDYAIPSPGPAINIAYFPNTSASYYWSSTTYAGNPDYAWGVLFGHGLVTSNPKYFNMYVRCVRGVQETAQNLSNNGNGTVTDNKTGLMWQQGEPGDMTWGSALSYCEGLSLVGNLDWRLPNVKGLESLTDDTRFYPAIDTNYFPNAITSYYWSSTTDATYASYPDDAWHVYFFSGRVYCSGGKDDGAYVRCVRGGQSGVYDNCASTLSSSDLSIHVSVLDFAGYHYWVDFMYEPDLDFTIVNVGEVSDLGPYNACAHATLSETTLGLHIPNLLFDGASYWADFAYKGGLTVTFVNAGGNSAGISFT